MIPNIKVNTLDIIRGVIQLITFIIVNIINGILNKICTFLINPIPPVGLMGINFILLDEYGAFA